MRKSKRITSHGQLIEEKDRLRDLIAEQQEQLQADLIRLKEAFWPFDLLNRFKDNLESFASNKIVALGVEIGYLILHLFLSKRKENVPNRDVIKSFIVSIIEDVIYLIRNKTQQQESDTSKT